MSVRRLSLALTALCWACGSKPPPPTESPVVQVLDAGPPEASDEPVDAGEVDAREPLPPASTPEEVAARWLESLRRVDPVLLGEWSRYPFLLHDTGDEGTCGQGAAADARQLPMLLGCLLRNEPLLIELRNNPAPEAHAIKAKDLPTWARRWRAELPNDAALVLVEISGHGTTSRFVFVVREGGVEALWKQTVFAEE